HRHAVIDLVDRGQHAGDPGETQAPGFVQRKGAVLARAPGDIGGWQRHASSRPANTRPWQRRTTATRRYLVLSEGPAASVAIITLQRLRGDQGERTRTAG